MITSSQSWDKIILFFSQDEHKALEQFFELFDEFSRTERNGAMPVIPQTFHSTTKKR